jgi:hypothetical protein
MFARCLRRVFLLVVVIWTCDVCLCRSSRAVVISRDFDLPIPSPDDPNSGIGQGAMEDAIIDVTEHISIRDLDIAVSLTHDSFFDLQIALESPAGMTIMLNPHSNDAFMTQAPDGRRVPVGGSNRFLFDDESAICIEDATPPFDQAFKPARGFELSVFDGQDAFGSWRLQIEDFWPDHTGRLERVELIVISSPEPSTALLFGLGVLVVCRTKCRGAARGVAKTERSSV